MSIRFKDPEIKAGYKIKIDNCRSDIEPISQRVFQVCNLEFVLEGHDLCTGRLQNRIINKISKSRIISFAIILQKTKIRCLYGGKSKKSL